MLKYFRQPEQALAVVVVNIPQMLGRGMQREPGVVLAEPEPPVVVAAAVRERLVLITQERLAVMVVMV